VIRQKLETGSNFHKNTFCEYKSSTSTMSQKFANFKGHAHFVTGKKQAVFYPDSYRLRGGGKNISEAYTTSH
jgi:hypothetical protein